MINPTYPIYNWGYNPLTKWDEPPSIISAKMVVPTIDTPVIIHFSIMFTCSMKSTIQRAWATPISSEPPARRNGPWETLAGA